MGFGPLPKVAFCVVFVIAASCVITVTLTQLLLFTGHTHYNALVIDLGTVPRGDLPAGFTGDSPKRFGKTFLDAGIRNFSAGIFGIRSPSSARELAELRRQFSTQIRIGLFTDHFFQQDDPYDRRIFTEGIQPGCRLPLDLSASGDADASPIPVRCSIEADARESIAKKKDVLSNFEMQLHSIDKVWRIDLFQYARLQTLGARGFPGQLIVGFTVEPERRRGYLQDPDSQKYFDLVMTTRLDSGIPILYPPIDFTSDGGSLASTDPLPAFEEKENGVLFMASNCHADSFRDRLVKQLMDAGVPVHSFGACLRNRQAFDTPRDASPSVRSAGKVKLMRRYKVCLAFENTNEIDYVTEKFWESLAAGCVPVVLGSPSVPRMYAPDVDSIIMANDQSFDALKAEIIQALFNKTRYLERVRWRTQMLHELAPGFQSIVRYGSGTSPHCLLCILARLNRIKQEQSSEME
jgi:hypothetical protein